MKYTNFGGLRLTLWSVVSRLIIQGHDRESVLEMFMSSDGFPRYLGNYYRRILWNSLYALKKINE